MAIEGIAEYLWIAMDDNRNLTTKRYSSVEKPSSGEDMSSQVLSEPASVVVSKEVEFGQWYAVYWRPSVYWFVGQALEKETDEQVRMELIHQTAAGANTYSSFVLQMFDGEVDQ